MNPSERFSIYADEQGGMPLEYDIWCFSAYLAIILLVLLFCGCAARKPKAAIPNTHSGPEHLECDAQNNCAVVQSTLTDKGNRQVLTPLGCAMKKAHLLQVFWIGSKNKPVCEKEIPKP